MKLTFGKYKNREIEQMTTPSEAQYLHWLLQSNIKLNKQVVITIKKHLNL